MIANNGVAKLRAKKRRQRRCMSEATRLQQKYSPMYNEPEFIKLIFLLADTQDWISALAKDAFLQLPVKDKSKLARKTFYLSIKAIAHILEKHYYKINRYPQSGKFTIPLTGIIEKIKEAADQTSEPI